MSTTSQSPGCVEISSSFDALISGPSPYGQPCGGPLGAVVEHNQQPQLAAHPHDPDVLVVSYRQGLEPGTWGAMSAYSRDGGRSWAHSPVTGSHLGTGGPYTLTGNESVAFGCDGTAYYAQILSRPTGDPTDFITYDGWIGVHRSQDAGPTWSEPVVIFGPHPGFPWHQPVVATDPSDAGRVYVLAILGDFDGTGRVEEALWLARSDDGGVTFPFREPVLDLRSERPSETWSNRIEVLPDGTVLIASKLEPRGAARLADDTLELRVLRSSDGGRTFEPGAVAWRTGVSLEPVVQTGRADGRLHVGASKTPYFGLATGSATTTWLAWASRDHGAVVARRSPDAGRTWEPPRRVKERANGAVFPAIAASSDDLVAVSYYHFEHDDPKVEEWTASYSISITADGGDTWAEHELARMDMRTMREGERDDYVYPGYWQGLVARPEGFGAAYAVGRPLAQHGPSDIRYSEVRVAAG